MCNYIPAHGTSRSKLVHVHALSISQAVNRFPPRFLSRGRTKQNIIKCATYMCEIFPKQQHTLSASSGFQFICVSRGQPRPCFWSEQEQQQPWHLADEGRKTCKSTKHLFWDEEVLAEKIGIGLSLAVEWIALAARGLVSFDVSMNLHELIMQVLLWII